MSERYLRIPLMIEQGSFSYSSKAESIRDFIHLILSTKIGSIRGLPDFGNRLWDKDISLSFLQHKEMVATIQQAISTNELRLVDVSVNIVREEHADEAVSKRVVVKAKYSEDGHLREFESSFSLGLN